jgi:DNA-binding GntR family transcriptional regulator
VYRPSRASRTAKKPASGFTSRSDEAYEQLKRMIFEHELPPGSRIGEAQLTRQLGMSRTPVREALARLESEGMLTAAPGRGFLVAELTVADLIDIYRVRAVLEGLAAEEAAGQATRVDIARLEDLYDAMTRASEQEDQDQELARLNSEFHALIAEISGNTYLQAMLEDIREVFEWFRTTALTLPGRRETAHEEHGQMIDALRRGDAGAARELAHGHVQRALAARQSLLCEKETR